MIGLTANGSKFNHRKEESASQFILCGLEFWCLDEIPPEDHFPQSRNSP